MGIIQSLAEQHTKTMFRTILSLMSGEVADETTTCAEEEISIMIVETGEGIEREAIHGHIDRGREERALVKTDLVDIVVIRHGLLKLL
jgi:hypothetical protein